MTKSIIKAGVSVAALTAAMGAAHAADLGPYRPRAPEPVYAPVVERGYPSWTGPYIGVNAGYGWGDTQMNYVGPGFAGTASPDADGWFGGGQLGYNLQFGAVVLGVEGDLQLADLTEDSSTFAGGRFVSSTNQLDWFSTVRGRVGFATGPALIYATGGLAFGDVDSRVAASNGVSSVALSGSGVETGYTVGGGVEWKLSPNLSTKVEYLYIDLGDQKLTGIGSNGQAFSADADNEFHTLRLGLNYKF